MAGVFGGEFRAQTGVREKMIPQRPENGFLKITNRHPGPVAAHGKAFVAGGLTPELSGGDEADPSSAHAAFEQAGEQGFGAALLVRDRPAADRNECALPVLHGLPEIVCDDAEVRPLFHDPVFFRVEPGDAFAARRVLLIAQFIPDDAADVEVVVEDPRASDTVAVDRGCAPEAAGRSRDLLRIQPPGDGPGGIAAREFIEDAPDDPGLRRVDDAFAPDRFAAGIEAADDFIPEAVPSSRFAGLHPASQAPAHFLGEVFQLQGVHRPFQADMEIGDLAFRQGDDSHAGEGQALIKPGDVGEVAGKPVESLGKDDFEPPRHGVLHELLDARPHERRP